MIFPCPYCRHRIMGEHLWRRCRTVSWRTNSFSAMPPSSYNTVAFINLSSHSPSFRKSSSHRIADISVVCIEHPFQIHSNCTWTCPYFTSCGFRIWSDRKCRLKTSWRDNTTNPPPGEKETFAMGPPTAWDARPTFSKQKHREWLCDYPFTKDLNTWPFVPASEIFSLRN